MLQAQFELFAGQGEFYIEDAQAEPPDNGLEETWFEFATAEKLTTGAGSFAVRTMEDATVTVTFEVHTHAPRENLAAWDYVLETNFDSVAGAIIFSSGGKLFPDTDDAPSGPSASFPLDPGSYGIRLYWGEPQTVTMGTSGRPRHRVVLWPCDYVEPRIVRDRSV